MTGYNVVLERTEGSHKGIRTWRTFPSREEFEKQCDQLPGKILAEELSDKECQRICREISTELILARAFTSARKRLNEIEPLLEMELRNAMFLFPISRENN
jgi:hypothetical protein